MTATLDRPAPAATGGGLGNVLTDSVTLTGRSLAHWVRNPATLIASLAFNIVMVLMFAFLFGGAMAVPDGGSYREFLMPGMFAMTMIFGISMTTIAISTDVERGVTDRFRSMPMAPAAILIGRAVADMLFAVVTLVVMMLVGLAIGWRANGSVGATLGAMGLILLLRFALIWVGIFLGLVMRGQEAVAGVQTLEFPLGFLSNAFVAPSTMPGWLGAIAEWNPLSSTVTATRVLFGNPGWGGGSWVVANASLMAVVWPLVILAVFLPLAVRRYASLSD
ncbi:ABC transporter permease [Actinokineospora spheciospongiae]|uniref:ABC transporter permease n=1 Tax=Actinokineospora spheciospongiae TaxID=909613 RepID=UPI000D9630CE|nr:ABC transporter DrrB family efflux protein [Actinokineospora spheciospongiae]